MDFQTLQTIFYSMGIIFMTVVFIAIIALVILGITLLARVNKIHKQIETILTEFKENPGGKAAEVVLSMGAGLANAGAKKVHKMLEKKQKS